MNRILSFIMAVVSFLSALFGGGSAHVNFKNEYTIPENTLPYTQIDTNPKSDWKAEYIWDSSDGSEANVWMCFRKTVGLSETPQSLTAYISADSRYWLYINGENIVFEGGVKRGPTTEDGYYDSVDIAPYLKTGKNTIAALVWYWGKDKNYSYAASGRGAFLFEAGSILSDSSWKVCRNTAYLNETGESGPNYRLPEANINYDARKEIVGWALPAFDDGLWENAVTCGTGGSAPWGKLYPRGIPMLKDYGLKDYENSADFSNVTFSSKTDITLNIPYNA